MLTGRYEPIQGLGQYNIPTTSESMASSFKSNYMHPFLLIPGMEEGKRKELSDRVSTLRMEADKSEGLGQRTANWFAGMAGSILNPLSLISGEAAGIIAKPLISIGAGLIGRYLPSESIALLNKPLTETVSKKLPNFIGKESASSLTRKAVSGYAQATGFSLPMEMANTYNPTIDSFNWFGGIKPSFEDGGFGLALMSVPYLAGALWGKLFGRVADHSKMPLPGEKSEHFNESHIDEAIRNKRWTSEQGKWFKDYIFNGDSKENLSKRATEMLIRDGHPVDSSTNQVMFKILHPDDVNNFQISVSDRLANNLPENIKNLYQDFIGHVRMDELRSDPNSTSVIDGLRGIVNFTRNRLIKMPDEIVKFHKIVRRLFPEKIKEKNPFSQIKIINEIKKFGKTNIEIPFQVKKRIKQKEIIKKIIQQTRDYQREFNNSGKKRFNNLIIKNKKKINDLIKNLEPLLNHSEEIKYLREKLLPEGKVIDNFKAIHEYRRLLDLTRVRNDARKLIHEINLKYEYELHESYATIIDTITKVMRSEFGKLAKIENINDYMKERIQSLEPKLKNIEIESVEKEVKESKIKLDKIYSEIKNFEGQSETLKSLDEEINKIESSENKKEYDQVKNQMNEFKENESIFSNLVKCVLGVTNE